MDYVSFYNRNIVGYYPGDEASNITACTIEHLLDNHFEKDLFQILLETGKNESYRPEDIPDALWEGSLLERGVYYMHKELQIMPPPPKIDSTGKEIPSDFFVEMKIRYTVKDILDYFYAQLNVNEGFVNTRLHSRQLETIINKYKKFDDVNSLDIILTAIDWASEDNKMVMEPFALDNADLIFQVYQNLRTKKMNGKGEIIWRRNPVTLSRLVEG